MIVVGLSGEQIGTVERFEIDPSGRLKSLVVRVASSVGTTKRIAADSIRSLQEDIVRVALSAAEITALDDAGDVDMIELWSDEILFR